MPWKNLERLWKVSKKCGWKRFLVRENSQKKVKNKFHAHFWLSRRKKHCSSALLRTSPPPSSAKGSIGLDPPPNADIIYDSSLKKISFFVRGFHWKKRYFLQKRIYSTCSWYLWDRHIFCNLIAYYCCQILTKLWHHQTKHLYFHHQPTFPTQKNQWTSPGEKKSNIEYSTLKEVSIEE